MATNVAIGQRQNKSCRRTDLTTELSRRRGDGCRDGRPLRLVRKGRSENRGERRSRILGAHHHIERITEPRDAGEVTIPRVRVKEPPGTQTRELAEEDVRQADEVVEVEGVERAKARKVALDNAVPVGPEVDGSTTAVIPYPHDLLVRGDGERNPCPVDVIAPEQVIRDDASGWVHHGDGTVEWEHFVALDVKHRGECVCQPCGIIRRVDGA